MLQSEFYLMKSKMHRLKHVLKDAHETMKGVKSSIKNSAILRNLTPRRPILSNDTHWTGNHDVLLQHTRIGTFLQEACGNENANFCMNRS